jgi:hypothetical protein
MDDVLLSVRAGPAWTRAEDSPGPPRGSSGAAVRCVRLFWTGGSNHGAMYRKRAFAARGRAGSRSQLAVDLVLDLIPSQAGPRLAKPFKFGPINKSEVTAVDTPAAVVVTRNRYRAAGLESYCQGRGRAAGWNVARGTTVSPGRKSGGGGGNGSGSGCLAVAAAQQHEQRCQQIWSSNSVGVAAAAAAVVKTGDLFVSERLNASKAY